MGQPLSYCTKCGTMVGGRHPGESGTFSAGFEPICNDCADMEKSDPTAPPRAPKTSAELAALLPEEPREPTPKPPPPAPPRRGSSRRVRGTMRRSGRFIRRESGNPALMILLGIGVLAAIVLVIVLAGRK